MAIVITRFYKHLPASVFFFSPSPSPVPGFSVYNWNNRCLPSSCRAFLNFRHLLLPLAVFAVILNLMNRADPLFKSETLKGVPFPRSVATHSSSQVDFESVLPGGSSPLKQPHPLMTVLPAQLEWNVADTGTGFNIAAKGAQNKWPHFFFLSFFYAIKRINCKHLCRQSERPRIFLTHNDNEAA